MGRPHVIIFVLLVGCAGAYVVGTHTEVVSLAHTRLTAASASAKERLTALTHALHPPPPPAPPTPHDVVVYLHNGHAIAGTLEFETEEALGLRWHGGVVRFGRGEIARIERGALLDAPDGLRLAEMPTTERWPYAHDVVVQLTNRTILDAELAEATPDHLVLRYTLEEGGAIEQELPREKVDVLRFRPVEVPETQRARDLLTEEFPSMTWFHEGAISILTDSPTPSVEAYQRTLRQHLTDFYLTFFPLLNGRTPHRQHLLVIFDTYEDFVEHAFADGLPGWSVGGYFSPVDRVLYTFNVLGDAFSDLLYDAWLGGIREALGDATNDVKGQVDTRYHIFIDGKIQSIEARFESAHGILRGIFREETNRVLRHELTHALFHNYGLQTVVVSTIKPLQEDQVRKKREFLETDDPEKKQELLRQLVEHQVEAEKDIEIEAANSWFVEGLAAYTETSPIGETNPTWLYQFQDAQHRRLVFPIEHLTNYRVGSFPGVAGQAALDAYAQSWALSHFLMSRHRDQFFTYLERMATEPPGKGDDLTWLLAALGTELRPLEEGFLAYMAELPTLENPALDLLGTLHELFQDLY